MKLRHRPTRKGQESGGDAGLARGRKESIEGLGIPCRPINVSNSKRLASNPDQNQGNRGRDRKSRGRPQKAQARAFSPKPARLLKKTQKAGEQATKLAQKRASDLARPRTAGAQTGPTRGSRSWNTLVSQLGDETPARPRQYSPRNNTSGHRAVISIRFRKNPSLYDVNEIERPVSGLSC